MKIRIEGCTQEALDLKHAGHPVGLTVGKHYLVDLAIPGAYWTKNDDGDKIYVQSTERGLQCAFLPTGATWVVVEGGPVMPEWISVEEALPPLGLEVLVYVPSKIENGRSPVTALSRYIRYEGATTFHWDNNYGGSNIHLSTSVTHWAFMPKAPA